MGACVTYRRGRFQTCPYYQPFEPLFRAHSLPFRVKRGISAWTTASSDAALRFFTTLRYVQNDMVRFQNDGRRRDQEEVFLPDRHYTNPSLCSIQSNDNQYNRNEH